MSDMGSPKRLFENDCKKDEEAASTSTFSSWNAIASPKTPVRTYDDSMDDDDSDEIESPQFPHLIPVNGRRNSCEEDLEGVRIGWDDGCGSVCFRDDDYSDHKRRMKRFNIGNSNLFSRRQRLFFDSRKSNDNSPSPRRSSSMNNLTLQAELNDYLGCILDHLSAKKKNRLLKKSLSETNANTNTNVESNDVKNLLDDSADDELLLLCSQAVEKTIASDPNYGTTSKTIDLEKLNASTMGVCPLQETNNNVYQHAAKKFKPQQNNSCTRIENIRPLYRTTVNDGKNKNQCRLPVSATITSNTNDEGSSSLLTDSLCNDDDDDLFLNIDLSTIEEQYSLNVQKNTTSSSTTWKSNTTNNDKKQNTTNPPSVFQPRSARYGFIAKKL